jgi:predicted chitinase
MISAANLDYMWSNLDARIGIPYKWGGILDPNDPTAGTDCSGAVGLVIEALLCGSAMSWNRPFWTGTFVGMAPGQVAAPWGLVCIAHPSDAPANAAAIVAINQGPTADTSHMIVRVLDRRDDPEGIDIEDNGQGLQKYDRAANITDPQFNQWFYLPGPLEMPALPPVSNLVTVLAKAIGLDVQRSQEILPAVRDGLTQSQCTTVNRIAMWLAQVGHESDGFRTTEEYESGDESQERWLYKGRTWIQITGRSNYAGFSQWCFDRQLVSSPTYFVENPRELADLKWAGLGPAWYWTVARPDINTLSDAGDLETVTQRINGGYNGQDDRRNRYNCADQMGDQFLALVGTAPLPAQHVPPQPPDYLRLIYDQLAGPVGSDGYGHGWPQLGNLSIVDFLAKYKPALDCLLEHCDEAATTTPPHTAILVAKTEAAPEQKPPAKKAPAKKSARRKSAEPPKKAAAPKPNPRLKKAAAPRKTPSKRA